MSEAIGNRFSQPILQDLLLQSVTVPNLHGLRKSLCIALAAGVLTQLAANGKVKPLAALLYHHP